MAARRAGSRPDWARPADPPRPRGRPGAPPAGCSSDADDVAEISLASFKATYAFPLSHTDARSGPGSATSSCPGPRPGWPSTRTGRPSGSCRSAWTSRPALPAPRSDRARHRQPVHRLAKALRPGGLELYTFQVNTGARRFYERHGFRVVDLDDGARNEEGQPDVRYRWLPVGPLDRDRRRSRHDSLPRRDRGSPGSGRGGHRRSSWSTGPRPTTPPGGPPCHCSRRATPCSRSTGAGVGRARTHLPYAIAREYEDVAAVVDAIVARRRAGSRRRRPLVWWRVGLGAALLTPTCGGSSSTRARPLRMAGRSRGPR